MTDRMRRLLLWMLGGAVLGGLAASSLMWIELWDRLTWSGGGDRADWGEPLFYAVLLALPGVGLGALLGACIGLLLRRLRRADEAN